MDWLNYHHLLYFWLTAKEGSVTAACARLHLAQPTVSAQIRALERSLGQKLFERSGRFLRLTDMGRLVYRYADDIFATGRELMDVIRGRPAGTPWRLNVGVADVLPKLIAYRLLAPAFRLPEPVRMVCTEGKPNELIAKLALHELDVVLSDTSLPAHLHLRGYSHVLGQCHVTFFGEKRMASRLRRGFPKSLDGAPMLLPTESTAVRRALDQWFESQSVTPQVIAEIEDGALLKVFGQSGLGLIPGPSAIEKEIREQYGLTVVGQVVAIKETFYAISLERKFKHPAVVAIAEAARGQLFA